MGRGYKHIGDFSASDSNTICDITGFKTKRSQVLKRWEGFYTLPDAWHPRQPQDRPVTPEPQKVYSDVRTQSEDEVTAESFTPF